MKRRKLGNSYIFLIAIIAVLVVAMVVLIVAMQTDEVEEALKNDQVIKILLVLHDGDRAIWSDLLVYYPVTRGGAVFDIPYNTGDLYSSIRRVDGIEAVYREKGIGSFVEEVKKLTGTDIPFTIEISLDNFSLLTDMLGGLRIFIPTPVDYEADGVHYLLPSGAVNLDGDKIRTYLEYALPEDSQSDIQDRKQNTVIAFLSALNKNQGTVFSKKVFPHYSKLFRTNVDSDGFHRLLQEISSIDADRLTPQTVTGSYRTTSDGKRLLFPLYDGQLIKDVVKQVTSALISNEGVMSSRVYVLEIQNGTTVQGLARNTAALLQGAGYDVLSMVNAPTNDVAQTYIIDHIGNETVAKGLADFIHCKNIETAEISDEDTLEADSQVDFTIVLGRDFDGRYVR